MKKFKNNDQTFICENCQKTVNKLFYSSRNHCPYCLYSKHVDLNPGDRLHDCNGLMKPIGIENYKGSYKISHQCQKCFIIKKNIIAKDDDLEQIIKISKQC